MQERREEVASELIHRGGERVREWEIRTNLRTKQLDSLLLLDESLNGGSVGEEGELGRSRTNETAEVSQRKTKTERSSTSFVQKSRDSPASGSTNTGPCEGSFVTALRPEEDAMGRRSAAVTTRRRVVEEEVERQFDLSFPRRKTALTPQREKPNLESF